MKKKLRPLNDVVFKKLFGENHDKILLIQFLNSVLHADISDLTIREEKLTIEKVEDKQGILDIKAELKNGERINIEVQLLNQHNMIHRTLFYWSKLYSENFKKKGNYSDLKKTIVINILGFNLLEEVPFHSSYHLYEDKFKVLLTDLIEVHFIEFPKFLSIEKDLNNPLHRWLLFLQGDAPEATLKEVCNMDSIIDMADKKLSFLSADEEIQRLADLKEKADADRIARDEYVVNQANLAVAKKLIQMGLSLEEIKEATGIELHELQKMKDEM